MLGNVPDKPPSVAVDALEDETPAHQGEQRHVKQVYTHPQRVAPEIAATRILHGVPEHHEDNQHALDRIPIPLPRACRGLPPPGARIFC